MPLRDLTHPIRDGDAGYPGDPPVELAAHATHAEDGYRVARVSLGSHAGTHVDAPSHLLEDGRTLDDYPVETFRFDARLVRLDAGQRERIEAADLPDSDADMLVLRTGWDRHWNAPSYFEHPYLSPEAGRKLADGGFHVGIDAPNVDPTPTDRAGADEPDGFPVHRSLFEADRLIVENLTGLDAVPERFTLRAFPLPLADADGAPVRAVASF